MRLILADPKVKAILVNIFGGITRGDEVAKGLIEARASRNAVPMVVRIVGHERRGGGRAARGGALRNGRGARRGGRQGRRRVEGGGGVSILIGRDTRLVVQGITGREGEFHSSRDARVRHAARRRGDARQGRAEVFEGTRARVQHRRRRRPRDRREHVLHLRAGSRRARCGARGRRGRDRARSSASPRASRRSTWSRSSRRSGRRRAAHRPQLPRRDVAGSGQGRDHPGLHPSRGPGRRRVALRDAHLRGGAGHDGRGHRPVHVRRHRWRPDHRDARSWTCSSCSRRTPRRTRSS